jgi:hypothetical protein
MARKKIEVTDEIVSRIEEYAGQGATLENIALLLDVSDSTLDRWLKLSQVQRAYKRGKLLAVNHIAGKLYALANEGDITAIIFYLKAQAHWSDRPDLQPVTPPSNVQVYVPSNERDSTPTGTARAIPE